jgi:LPXTG-site transpeptidase (sortase) family protein
MEAPRDPKTVGWLNIGPKPGEIGNAIFAGHYDDQSGHPAIFAHLQRIPIGSEIMVHMVDGTQRSFFVDFVGETNTAENNIQAITRQTSYPSITLVTCHGSWDARNGIYSKRLIVYGK